VDAVEGPDLPGEHELDGRTESVSQGEPQEGAAGPVPDVVDVGAKGQCRDSMRIPGQPAQPRSERP
jgi:hypothetical protein